MLIGLEGTNLQLHPRSRVSLSGIEYALARTDAGDCLVILSDDPADIPQAFNGTSSEVGNKNLLVCKLSNQNARALRCHLPWLQPCPLGLQTSVGMGDRLGLATPGHVLAVQAVGGGLRPIFAQQSIRENSRTGRTPQQVLDDATWGSFFSGWRDVQGADADHLKTIDDIDSCLTAGYTFFTIDPGAHVDNAAQSADLDELRQFAEALPAEVSIRASGLLNRKFAIEHLHIHMDEMTLLRAAVKYGRAVLHVSRMYNHLIRAAGSHPVELEVSVDETEQPTTHAEHVYIACELARLGVHWVSLAPRFIGRFEKGVDYIGDLAAFEADFAGHAAIARHFGPYKLSLHSGSDKFSIYPLAARLANGLVHLKTAGTSYLEALRTLARFDPDFFREIYTFALERYPQDRASYHVSADVSRAPRPQDVTDWSSVLDQFDSRQILHVTFGSVLTNPGPEGGRLFYNRLMDFLRTHREEYASGLEKHFIQHLSNFSHPH